MTDRDPHPLPMTFGEFCRMAGRPREPFQERPFELRKRTTVVVSCRQSGKTETLALALLWLAYRERERKILVVSAGELAGKRVVAVMRAIATSGPLAGSIVNDEQLLMEFTNGSRVRAVPASEPAIRGETAHYLAMDECALMSDAVGVAAAIPTVAAFEDGKIIMVSSAGPASGFFFDHAELGRGHSDYVETYFWDVDDCWWISASAKEAFRQSASEQRYSSEFLNIFGGTSDNLLDRRTLDPVRVDYLQDRVESMMPRAKVFTGHDWAMAGPDFSTAVATGRLALPGKRAYGVRMTHKWPLGTPGHVVVEDFARTPGHVEAMNSETNGLGGPMTEQLWRAWFQRSREAGGGNPRRVQFVLVSEEPWMVKPAPMPSRRRDAHPEPTLKRPVFMTAALKAALFGNLRLLFERHRLLIPASAEDLYRELLQLKVDLTATGERIEARAGHDDLSMALALSLTPYRDSNGAWRTRVSDLADPTISYLPEPVLPAAMAGVELLPGPGDLLIPRTPAWMSVDGPEITLPSNLDLSDPSLRVLREQMRVALTNDTRS